MRALLAIDEGLLSPGVAELRRSLIESGFAVAMLGCDSRDEAAGDRRPESMIMVGGDSRNPVFELDGSPTDCVHIALGSDLVEKVDLVIAGLGARRAGDAVLQAAREAALMGRPALALAIDVSVETDFAWCGVVVAELAAWMLASPLPVRGILKLAVPARLSGRGLELARADTSRKRVMHHICVTPIALDAATDFAGERLFAWAEETIEAINPRLGVTGGSCLAGCCG